MAKLSSGGPNVKTCISFVVIILELQRRPPLAESNAIFRFAPSSHPMYCHVHKSGMLVKQGSRQGLLRRPSWKRRYVELTRTELIYYENDKTTESRPPKGSLDISMCRVMDLEIMPTDKTTKCDVSPWRVAIRTPARRFVFAAADEAEMYEWITALRSIFDANERYTRVWDDESTTASSSNNGRRASLSGATATSFRLCLEGMTQNERCTAA
ncbi:Aste57867_21501 [Aphanomyces stellatus]|uniref:Aste57867_21501 protein n=1 Tax=Aphanomyces stellatus TaxID=120398 RepID=A0A485LID4_9STRA|nr:hypothetical protein As57867_021432 [Aphanomyces stellatus]VFT98171.1 Aste57867_21501 [Aphanomyces stellatus]